MRILMIGHACGPDVGSEPGNTWNLATNLAAQHEVWVLTQAQHRDTIEQALASAPNPRLRIIYVKINPDPWNPATGERRIRLHYLLWQRKAAKEARRLCASTHFDVIHHFSLGTVKSPPHLRNMPAPVVWGPMGGGQTMPPGFSRYFKGQLGQEYFRIALIKMLPFLPSLPLVPSLRRMVKESAVVLANNRETVRLLKAAGAQQVDLLLDSAIPASSLIDQPQARGDRKELNVFWAGRMERRKTLQLGLEALAQTQMPIRMRIAGGGDMREPYEAESRRLGLADRVEFLGRVPFPKMAQYFREADIFLFTSLRDSSGNVLLEAAARALPVLALDHQGVGAMVPNSASIKVPVTTPEQVTRELAQAMDQLARSPELRQSLAAGALAWARENTWQMRAQQMIGFYEKAIALGPSSQRRS
jgi:glycosyltransferase involved in cell wall biosynthesis